MSVSAIAHGLVGLPYGWSRVLDKGNGLNCIGLVHWARTDAGLWCPETAVELAVAGVHVDVPRPGDLAVIAASARWAREGRPWHFGIVCEDVTKMVHASSKRGIEVRAVPTHRPLEFRHL